MGKRIPTNLRTLLVLEALAAAGRPLTPTEINATLDLPKPTIHRICDRLAEAGFVTRRQGDTRIWPSRRLRQFALAILSGTQGHIFRHQAIEIVAETIGEACNLVVADDGGMLYIDRVESSWPLNFRLPVGSHVPFHCTASGKLFLSALDDGHLRRFLPLLALSAEGPNTITDRDALMFELDLIREQGFSEDNQEFLAGMVAVAVPVRGPDGEFFAALAAHGAVLRFPYERLRDHLPTLYEGARQIEHVMFGEG